MPLYEYLCDSCSQRTEVLQKVDEPPLAVCPNCGGALKKLLSAPAFQFKGSGWYVTDYAAKGGGESRESKPTGEKAPGAEKKPAAAEPAAASDAAKPAAKPSSGQGGE